MEENPRRRGRRKPTIFLSFPTTKKSLLVFFCFFTFILNVSAQLTAPSKKSDFFIPQDNYLLDCGSSTKTAVSNNLVFLPDQETGKYLSINGHDIQVSVPSANVSLPIYLSAKVFLQDAIYTFNVVRVGWHWIRLHFFALPNKDFDLQRAKFTVTANNFVLLHEFQVENGSNWMVKEFLFNATIERCNIVFVPAKGSYAFINAIEFVSAPDILLTDDGSNLLPVQPYSGLFNNAYQTIYRLNVGGSLISPGNDTLGRIWDSDKPYLKPEFAGNNVSVAPSTVNYPDGGSPLIAPPSVYSTAIEMANVDVSTPNFNVTWSLDIDTSYSYVVRLHFCDIVSKSLNDLYFNVYINGKMGISGLDLSSMFNELATAYFKDFVVNSSVLSSPFTIQIGPMNEPMGSKNAILNGIEILKMNNSVGSLNGEYGTDGTKLVGAGPSRQAVATVGFAMMFGAFVGLGAMAVKWQKRPQDWQRRNSFSSWLLPIHASDTSFMSNSKTSTGSRNSQLYSSTMGLGRYFCFVELQEATNNWEPSAIIGVGGFGNVYIGEIDNGTKVAVKRGNPQSEQGINEFQTEIQMLSKLRHRHLVSLIGYCDENSEMILVYEYMANGPLRDHLYGKDLPVLSWKQRLEACIGAARGLHYLHTGAATGIIHRDVKTTNILLDENFVAKMADFGLSKDAPSTGQGYVSTAVKGSFGYLDPEYFRKQQLTDKSDVYSFGVVLLEALCARSALNPALPREQVNLAEWAMQWKRKGLLEKIIDTNLVGHINPESMKKFGEAAEKCLAEYGVDRPTMGDVLWNLEYALQLQEASSQDKGSENEENKAMPAAAATSSPAVVVLTTTSSDEEKPNASPHESNDHGEIEVLDDHSKTVMFSQFDTLSGR